MKILLKNVSYHYSDFSDDGVEDISLEISSNKKVAIVGETGSGKSTLLKLLKGLLKIDNGNIFYETFEKPLKIAYLFQYVEHQIFETTVYRDIAYSLKKTKLNENEILKKVEEVLELVGLNTSYLHRSSLTLSGGEKKRVAMAGILIDKPDFMLLDEPTVGLDSKGKEKLFKILSEWQAENKKRTFIFVSHDMNDVLEYADEIIVMHKGRVLYHMEVGEFFTKHGEILENIGLELPESMKFLNVLNSKLEEKINIENKISEKAILNIIEERLKNKKRRK
ncbi:MAG: ATP-binding cassette domain-containing protein, partial [Fusobacterium sp.]|nr:ATP-binding cassette domain-containing protein [Fusobacterium sp.]